MWPLRGYVAATAVVGSSLERVRVRRRRKDTNLAVRTRCCTGASLWSRPCPSAVKSAAGGLQADAAGCAQQQSGKT